MCIPDPDYETKECPVAARGHQNSQGQESKGRGLFCARPASRQSAKGGKSNPELSQGDMLWASKREEGPRVCTSRECALEDREASDRPGKCTHRATTHARPQAQSMDHTTHDQDRTGTPSLQSRIERWKEAGLSVASRHMTPEPGHHDRAATTGKAGVAVSTGLEARSAEVDGFRPSETAMTSTSSERPRPIVNRATLGPTQRRPEGAPIDDAQRRKYIGHNYDHQGRPPK